ncbi:MULTISPECIES: 2-keto-4-pentenoate hydratase [unclassified Herbaspirillum]|uniref:2-keto-4-pentenoate hydratase n=1 Tax=unclassified Herbaspirillum TaxID=2624150 RepID=UPI001153D0BA|nr:MULTISPECIES: hydratase [unclassified Herbaspirillum]MBB5393435.1 2-keto-4-pentenoate hydratase [Herbaspirillum sp. SJZ102]TQK03817.1 2-keto-4-pentenoate hydratase [Herbaspirillum sp. SJZ130]TQK08549.1 2-keto-4-pentenoate hydratase [Herbaspirillum sp. SJZ106]
MLNESQRQQAADLLWDCWAHGRRIAQLPPELCPADRAEAYAVQARLEAHSFAPLAGWKIGATGPGGQKLLNVDAPLAGRLLAERIHRNGAVISLGNSLMSVVEVEVAFRMRTSLPPRSAPYSQEEVLDAVGSVYPAIELPDTRYDNFKQVGAAQLIADNACADQFVLGAPADVDWRALDLAALPTFGRISGGEQRDGSGAQVLGDPRIALTWLANELSRQGLTLAEGQIVASGSTIVPLPVRAGQGVLADLGPLGSVAIELA